MDPLTRPATQAPRQLFTLPAGVLYLDSAAQGPRLRAVLRAGQQALADSVAPWRVSMAAWQAQLERVRALAAGPLDGDAEAMACVPSAAFGLATAARNLPLAAGEAVLVLDGQFPSNLLAWQQHCAGHGGHLVAATRQPDETWTAAVLRQLATSPAIRIVTVPQAHWHDGALLDLDAVAAAVHAHGAALVLDLSQSLGVMPVDLARWRPQFVVSVGHKWLLGPTGMAWLWCAPHWREHGVPIEQHWTARTVEDWRYDLQVPAPYRAGARRFDAGGVADAPRLAMAEAALSQWRDWGADAVVAHLSALTTQLDAALDAAGLGDWTTPRHAPHLTALRPPAADAARLHAALQAAGIICTLRHGLLRIAPHLHVDADGMHSVVDVLRAALR